jgi:hypothetical protein
MSIYKHTHLTHSHAVIHFKGIHKPLSDNMIFSWNIFPLMKSCTFFAPFVFSTLFAHVLFLWNPEFFLWYFPLMSLYWKIRLPGLCLLKRQRNSVMETDCVLWFLSLLLLNVRYSILRLLNMVSCSYRYEVSLPPSSGSKSQKSYNLS